MDQTELRRLLKDLRDRCPTPYPVKVRQVSAAGKDWDAIATPTHYSNGKIKHFNIFLRKNLSLGYSRYLLMHEWAHCMAWDDKEDHGKRWGKKFAKVKNKSPSWGRKFSSVYQKIVEP